MCSMCVSHFLMPSKTFKGSEQKLHGWVTAWTQWCTSSIFRFSVDQVRRSGKTTGVILMSTTAHLKESYEWNPCSEVQMCLCAIIRHYIIGTFSENHRKKKKKNMHRKTLCCLPRGIFNYWAVAIHIRRDLTCRLSSKKKKKKFIEKVEDKWNILHSPHFQKDLLPPQAADMISLSCLSQTSHIIHLHRP